jgi:hypothetical protein
LGILPQASSITVSSITPNNGYTLGGQYVTIEGSGWDYADYVTTNLVAMYLGDNNMGTASSKVFDPASTTWKDLSGNGYDLEMRNNGIATTNFNGSTWSSKGFLFGGNNYFARGGSAGPNMALLPTGNANYSVESVVDPNAGSNAAGLVSWGNHNVINNSNATRISDKTESNPCIKFVNYRWGNDKTTCVLKNASPIMSVSFTASNSAATVTTYGNGTQTTLTDNTGSGSPNVATCGAFFVGRTSRAATTTDNCPNQNANVSTTEYGNGMRIFATRVYSAALTPAQVAQNYIADKVRFIAPPAVTIGGAPCTDVEVISATKLTCKTGPRAAMQNAPVVVTYDGVSSVPKSAYTYKELTVSSVTPNVGPVAGGQTIKINGTNFPYASSESYIKDGLVLQLDAINNQGLGDQNHSSSLTKWVDLSGDGYDMDLRKDATAQTNLTTCGTTSWQPAGFKFANNCYFARGTTTASTISVAASNPALKLSTYMPKMPFGNSNYTFEAIYNPTGAPANAGLLSYGSVATTSNNNSFRLSSSSSTDKQYFRHYWWSNDYDFYAPKATGAVTSSVVSYDKTRGRQAYYDGSTSEITGESGAKGNRDANFADCGSLFVGRTGFASNSNDRCDATTSAESTEFANNLELRSVRIYNRPLSDAEIKANYALDQVRFQDLPEITIGGSACNNVVVLSETVMQCTTTGHIAASTPITIGWNGLTMTTGTQMYTYVGTDKTYINSTSPASGPKYAAGQVLTISGNKLDAVSSVTVGGSACTIGIKTSAQVTCTIPAGAVGLKDIKVTYTGGSQTLTGAFEYLDASNDPVKYRVQRSAGLSSGQYEYTLAGASSIPLPSTSICPVGYTKSGADCNAQDATGAQGPYVEPAWTGITSVTLTYPTSLTPPTTPAGWTATGPTDAQAGNKTLTLTASTLQTSDAVAAMLKALKWTSTSGATNVGGTITAQLTNGLW